MSLKKMRIRVCIFFIVYLLVSLEIFSLPRIAVLDFKVPEHAVHMNKGFEEIQWNPERTNTLTNTFVTVLANTKKFDIIEREQLQAINSERIFAELTSGNITSMGGFAGAEYCIVGEVKNLSCGLSETQIPYSTYTKKEFTGEVDLLVRMIYVGNGKIIVARDVNVRKITQSISSQEAFLNDLIKETAEKIISLLIEGAYPPKIASVDNTNIYINRGIDSGFKVGTRLMVYSLGKDIIDPDTHQKIGNEETPIGEIEVVEIQPKISKAIPVSLPITEFKTGMICRVTQIEPVIPPKPLTPGSGSSPIKWN